MKYLALPVCALLTACAHTPGTHYQVVADVVVRDPVVICKRAWEIALPVWGPSVAEMLTMTRGQWDARKCIATVYQVLAPEGLTSAGIYVGEPE